MPKMPPSTSPRLAAVLALLATLLPAAATAAGGAGAPGKPRRVEAGETAPALSVEAVVQGGSPADLTPEALRGQAVVVEFWSTWCGPCIGALPHWNELAAAFAGKPVRFVSITSEPEEKVRPFLAKRPMSGVVALDTDKSVFTAYGVRGIPHTVLIDPQGTVRAVTRPDDVDAGALVDLLAGRAPQVATFVDPRDRLAELLGGESDGPTPLVRAMIRPALSDEQTMAFGAGTYFGTGVDARAALALAFETSETRLIAEGELPEGLFDLAFAAPPEDEEALFGLMRHAVPAALAVEARLEKRPLDVWLLRVPEGRKPALVEGDGPPGFRSDRAKGTLRGEALRTFMLAGSLERTLGRPVLDETGLEGRYAIELTWDPQRLEDLPAAVREQLGLELAPARREIKVLVVRPKPEPSAEQAAAAH
ncbi:MAG TPA: TIGR03435 family protein [Thermoanaerobaculia bacterium]|nr:TIGR03435 family protein [Thermoanaerobaculia bacterium]